MTTMLKRLAGLALTVGFLLGMTGTAAAIHSSRADGICGGSWHYNPITGCYDPTDP